MLSHNKYPLLILIRFVWGLLGYFIKLSFKFLYLFSVGAKVFVLGILGFFEFSAFGFKFFEFKTKAVVLLF